MGNNNDKISIDVEINASGQQQLEQYKVAFNNLRDSISSLSDPISKLNSDLNTLSNSSNSLTKQNNLVGESIDKVKNGFDQAKFVADAFKKALGILEIGVISLEEALTGGLTVLLMFAPEIIKWVGEMIKGNTTLSALNKTLKDNKIVIDAVNGAKLQGVKNAQQELTQLKLLYTAAQDHNLKLSERKKIVTQLQTQYPDYFSKMSTEAILNGKAAKSYDELTKSIIASSKAKAAGNLMVKNQERQLANDNELTKLNAELTKYNKLVDQAQKASNVVNKSFDAYGGGNSADSKTKELASKLSGLQTQRDAIQKAINDFTTDSNLLDKQNQLLTKSVIADTEKHGASVLSVANGISGNIKPSGSQAGDAVQAQANQFAQRVEVTKQQYDTELANFKQQLNDKQIAQEAYDGLTSKLQDKLYGDLKEKIAAFNSQDLAETLQHQKDMVEAQKMSDDQNDINKAILPGQKLAAEKKMIEDKYNFEIQMTAEAGKDTAEIRQRYAKETADADKKFAQERKDFEVKTTQEVSNAAFSILQNGIKSQSDAKIKQLETQKTAELNNSSLTSSQKQAIEDKYAKKEADEKTKAFKAEQKASMLQAVINGALAITKATAQDGVLAPFVIPGIIAETAVQVATIAAQKAPQYAKGGVHYQSDGRGALLSGYSRTDNMNAQLRSGEAVVVSEAMRDPWARNLVSAINVAYGGRDFSVTNPGHGYAIGGIFTDGGNSNRYYNQPMNDQKDLANTIAYQMINNFPPVYVDVKDINNQQNILAQTVNRVNL